MQFFFCKTSVLMRGYLLSFTPNLLVVQSKRSEGEGRSAGIVQVRCQHAVQWWAALGRQLHAESETH